MRSLLRLILVNAVMGRDQEDLQIDLMTRLMDGGEIPHKLTSKCVAPMVEYLGALAATSIEAQLLYAPMRGLGIPSDIEMTFDPMTIGRLFKSMRATLNVIGVVFSCEQEELNGSAAVFAGSSPEGPDGRAAYKYKSLLATLSKGPVGIAEAHFKRTWLAWQLTANMRVVSRVHLVTTHWLWAPCFLATLEGLKSLHGTDSIA